MQCVIAAGGRGTRLEHFTEKLPKPMVPVHGYPLLPWLLAKVNFYGISDFLLPTGYLHHKIEGYFGTGQQFGYSIKYSNEDEPLGSGGALLAAKNQLKSKFFYMNSDDYMNIKK